MNPVWQACVSAAALYALAVGCASLSQARASETEYEVEKPAHPLAGNPAPRYPAVLAKEKVGGQVVVRFLVTTNGLVDTSTIEVVSSPHPLFSAAVREVLPLHRFLPAEVGGTIPRKCAERSTASTSCSRRTKPGRRVAQMLEIPFNFTPPPA